LANSSNSVGARHARPRLAVIATSAAGRNASPTSPDQRGSCGSAPTTPGRVAVGVEPPQVHPRAAQNAPAAEIRLFEYEVPTPRAAAPGTNGSPPRVALCCANPDTPNVPRVFAPNA